MSFIRRKTMNSIKRIFCAALIFLLSFGILFAVLKIAAHAEDMVVDDFVKYLLLVIIPLGLILFTMEGDGAFGKICRAAGFLIVAVPTLIFHLGIPGSTDPFYLTYLILPISWWVMAVLSIHIYNGKDIEIDGWVILCSILTLMLVLVVTQYIIYGTPSADDLKDAVNTYLIIGGISLIAIGIVILKERGYKREYERNHRPGVQRAPNPLAFDSDRYYCYDCKHCDFIIDDHGITHHYCKLSNTEVSYGRKQCSDKFERRW